MARPLNICGIYETSDGKRGPFLDRTDTLETRTLYHSVGGCMLRVPLFLATVVTIFLGGTMSSVAEQNSIYSLEATSIDGETVKLSSFEGKVLLIVNVASQCGFTPQYEGLQELHKTYAEQGLVILGFPSNDFGGQEPGSDGEIKKFCTSRFGVSFPMFSKVHTKGEHQHPLYALLTQSTGGRSVGWNFEKFLVNRHGIVTERFDSNVSPGSTELTSAIKKALSEK